MDKLLLDTTYILPIFGVKVSLKNYEEMFPKLLEEYVVLYNPLSLVEAKWIILKLTRRVPSKRNLLLRAYRRGLEALLSDERLKNTILTDIKIEEIADRLLVEIGLKDYFDRMIYATAVYEGAILLTEDEELIRIRKEGSVSPKEVLRWNEVIQKIER